MKVVKKVFEQEYQQKTLAAKCRLAGELVAEADKIKSNFEARYVLLDEALAAASSSGDVVDCRDALSGLERSFRLDPKLTTDLLTKLAENGAGDSALADWAAELIEQRFDQDDFQGARKLIRLVSAKLARSQDGAARAKLTKEESVLTEYDKAHLAIEKLKRDPADAAANFAGGKFFCFFRHSWERGLLLLARGTDAKLKDLAAADLANPVDPSARYALGGRWWDLGEDKMHASLQSHLRERARYWYRLALPGLEGLEKTMADKRSTEPVPPAMRAPVAATGSGSLPKKGAAKTYFIGQVESSLSAAMIRAKRENKGVFLVIYDNKNPTKSRLDVALGYFTLFDTTKKLLADNFVPIMADLHSPDVGQYVPAGNPLEICYYVALSADGKILKQAEVYGNPDEGLSQTQKIVKKWEEVRK